MGSETIQLSQALTQTVQLCNAVLQRETSTDLTAALRAAITDLSSQASAMATTAAAATSLDGFSARSAWSVCERLRAAIPSTFRLAPQFLQAAQNARRLAERYGDFAEIAPEDATALTGWIADGDSITSRSFREGIINTITKSGTVATVTTAAATSLLPGMLVKVHGVLQDYYNGWKIVTTVADGTHFTYTIDERAAAAGTIGGHPMQFFSWQHKTHNWLTLVEALSGHSYGFLPPAAGGSRLSAERSTDFKEGVLATNAMGVIMQTSMNDVVSAVVTTPAQTAANMEKDIIAARAGGKKVILITPTPFDSTYNTAANNEDQQTLRRNVILLGKKHKLPCVDAYGLFVNPSAATATPRAGYCDTDGLHWAGGNLDVAQAMFPILDELGGWELIPLPMNIYDQFGNAGSTNLLANSEMTGTNGTATLVTSGTDVATGWIVTNASMTTCEVSKGTLGNMAKSQIITVGGTAGSCTLVSESLTARITAGKVLRLVCRVKLTLDNTFRLAVYISLTPTGGTNGLIFATSIAVTTSLPKAVADQELILASNPFTVPAGATYSAATFGLQYVATAGGAAGPINVAQPGIYQDAA